MPQIGEIRKGRDIGYGYYHKYIWQPCSICGKERWVEVICGQPRKLKCPSCVQRGKTLSSEHRAKMSAAHKGHQYCLGNKLTEEHKEKIGQGVKAFFGVPENRAKISGSNSHRWQGGVSKVPYPFAFTQKLKEAIRNRDNHTCQLCGVPQLECLTTLRVHHIDYDKDNLSWSNLITLCNRCNSKVNWNRAYWQDYFNQIIKQKED
ncbi:hypothetical protein ES708_30624 [subsurface metagenome]